MKDYYEILGLDADASLSSIKVAYRRLAKEAHPDRVSHLGEEAVAEASARMSEINEAYAVLSTAAQRSQYDAQVRQAEGGPAPPVEVGAPPPESDFYAAPNPARARVRPAASTMATLASQFSSQIRSRLIADPKSFAWEDLRLEGFEWALRTGSLTTKYYVAARSFGSADLPAARKFTNYCQFAISRRRSLLRRNYFLLLMPFHRMSDPDKVAAVCRRFNSTVARQALLVMIDVTHGRTLPCGPRISDERFQQLLKRVGVGRT